MNVPNITIEGKTYHARRTSKKGVWCIVHGYSSEGIVVKGGIKAKNGKEAINLWISQIKSRG